MIKRKINLKNDQVLEVDLTPEFLSRLVEHFSLESEEHIEDHHVVTFLFGAVKSSIDKAERESSDLK